MSVCDLVTSTSHLQKTTVELGKSWADTRTTWQDETARAYEQRFLVPLVLRQHRGACGTVDIACSP